MALYGVSMLDWHWSFSSKREAGFPVGVLVMVIDGKP
jgi:hypothetical protein